MVVLTWIWIIKMQFNIKLAISIVGSLWKRYLKFRPVIFDLISQKFTLNGNLVFTEHPVLISMYNALAAEIQSYNYGILRNTFHAAIGFTI